MNKIFTRVVTMGKVKVKVIGISSDWRDSAKRPGFSFVWKAPSGRYLKLLLQQAKFGSRVSHALPRLNQTWIRAPSCAQILATSEVAEGQEVHNTYGELSNCDLVKQVWTFACYFVVSFMVRSRFLSWPQKASHLWEFIKSGSLCHPAHCWWLIVAKQCSIAKGAL